ncbi:MAG TPA: hypothetical protein VKT49_06835 [Bryobacteraceae bacterium]|nr:hypothetical protein [Bryobacteraceae bacterium]
MFPWNYGFHWGAVSIVFLGAFYCVLTVISTTLILALRRTYRSAAQGRADRIRWRSEFQELAARDRLCRHMLSGEFPYRECRNAFDCRRCEAHARILEKRRPAAVAETEEEVFGMAFPLDRLYHRGHTSVLPQPDGTALVELDELGRRLIGVPDQIALPQPGTRLRANGTGWRIRKREADIRVLAPVDGEVVDVSPARGGCLLVRPAEAAFDHLLTKSEVRPWLLREMERLQLALTAQGAPTLADGGVPVDDILASYPSADWDAVCSRMFLQP